MTKPEEVWTALVAERPRTVLLVDDEPDIRESLKAFLEARLPGLRVLTCASGTEALRTLEHEAVDLIITDYRMPGMDGLEFLRQAQRVAPRVPRIMVTAYPELELAMRAINEGGVQKFVTKPVKPEIADYVRVALMDARDREIWGRSFAMKLSGSGGE